MRSSLFVGLAMVFVMGVVLEFSTTASTNLATVTLGVSDTFGQPLSDCRVDRFVLLDDNANVEYKHRFIGLIGRRIPFGDSYAINVRCLDSKSSGSAVESVRREDQFIELAASPFEGDYYTGLDPRLTVRVKFDGGAQIAREAWVQLIALYGKQREVEKVDSRSG